LTFLACAEINNAHATIRQNRCNMLLAVNRFGTFERRRLTVASTARHWRRIEVNTCIKFVERAADKRTVA